MLRNVRFHSFGLCSFTQEYRFVRSNPLVLLNLVDGETHLTVAIGNNGGPANCAKLQTQNAFLIPRLSPSKN